MNIEYATNMQARSEEDNDGKFASAHAYPSYDSPATGPQSSNDSEESKRKYGGDGIKFVIRKQPPNHLFPNQQFEIEYGVIRADETSDLIPQRYILELKDMQIQADLMESDDSTVARSGLKPILSDRGRLVVLEQKRATAGVSGTLTCRIDNYDDLTGFENDRKERKFSIRITSKRMLEAGTSIGSVMSRTISVAPFKMVITTTSAWEKVWFKDEGGRDKCIEIIVGSEDENEQLLFEQIQLKLTLCYDVSKNSATGEPIPVSSQDILKVLGRVSNRQHVDPETGKAKVRFRVEDVSKNHQGQNFVLKVEAERPWNISPGFSPPITIRSKRSKMNRKGSLTGGSDHSTPLGVQTSPTPAVPWRPFAPHDINDFNKESPISLDAIDPVRLQQAYYGVVQWIDDVVTGLPSLQWQVLGYAQHPDGSIDYSRPCHNMPSPNSFISRVLGMYNDATRKYLRVIGDAVEQHANKGRMPLSPQPESFERDAAAYGSYAGSRNQSVFPPVYFDFQQQSSHYHPHLPHMMSPRMPMPPNKQENISQQVPPFPIRDIRDPSYQFESPHAMPRSQQQYPPNPNMQFQHSMRNPPLQVPENRIDVKKLNSRFAEYLPDESAAKRMKLGGVGQTAYGNPSSPNLPSPHQLHVPGRMGEYGSRTTTQESEVEFVLAKQHKSLRTGERLGFPAYSIRREIIGFYRETQSSASSGLAAPQLKFVPIGQHAQDFGPEEKMQATEILTEAISSESGAVHRLQDWRSIDNLLNQCMVYEWSRGLGDSSTGVGEKG